MAKWGEGRKECRGGGMSGNMCTCVHVMCEYGPGTEYCSSKCKDPYVMSSMRNFFFTTRANRNNYTVMQSEKRRL